MNNYGNMDKISLKKSIQMYRKMQEYYRVIYSIPLKRYNKKNSKLEKYFKRKMI